MSSERAGVREVLAQLKEAEADLDNLTAQQRREKWLLSIGVDPSSEEAQRVRMVIRRPRARA